MRKPEPNLRKVIRNTEMKLGEFLSIFYKKIDNLKNIDQDPDIMQFLNDYNVYLKKNKQFLFGGIFLWNDLKKEHIFLGDFFPEKNARINKIKNWLFSGEKQKEIELFVKFVLKEWKDKAKIIQIAFKKNNQDYIDSVVLPLRTRDMEKIPELIDKHIDYPEFFDEVLVKRVLKYYSDNFKIKLSPHLMDSTIKIDEISIRLAKNVILMHGYNVKWEYVYVIPALLYHPEICGKVKGHYPTGGLFIGTNRAISEETLFSLKVFITTISSHIALIFQNREIASHSLRSAVSAIMGRNMSHNIGSHVMARISTGGINGWTTHLSNDKILEKLFEDKQPENDEIKKKKLEEKKRNMNSIIVWSKDVQYLSRYIQQRMDFIAQISTEWPSWTEPAYLMNDLMHWFLAQKHLLNHIAASEGLQSHSFESDKTNDNNIRFHIFLVRKTCWNVGAIDSLQERMDSLKPNSNTKTGHDKPKCFIHTTQECKSCDTCRSALLFTPSSGPAKYRMDEDIPLAIPGGIVGYHALYIILENIIRNGAKHDYTRRKEEADKHFDVVIEVLHDPDETIGIQIHRGIENKRIPAYLFRIYNNTSKIGDSLRLWDAGSQKGINNALQTSIITETGELNKGNWGLAEMKIAAGYLQQRDISHIGDGKERITGQEVDNLMQLGESGSDAIIKAVKSPIGTLGYEFYIPKPRTVGIVCREGKEANNVH